MAQKADTEATIRPFDGSQSDALGLLAVEKATFDESPYSGDQVRTMLSVGTQRAWVAVGRDKVVGSVVAFPIHGLRGSSWEIDLLAVLPEWRGRRLATRLVQAAAAHGAGLAAWSRAVVATDNTASSRALLRVGYRPGAETNTLLTCQTEALAAGRWSEPSLPVREVDSLAEARNWLTGDFVEREQLSLAWPVSYRVSLQPGHKGQPSTLALSDSRPHLTLLVAERAGQIVGHAELLEVQTILYRGVWIESLVAQDRTARYALVHSVLSRAKARGLDEIGAMVPRSNPRLHQALVMSGFRSMGEYRWHTADLSLLELGASGRSSSAAKAEG